MCHAQARGMPLQRLCLQADAKVLMQAQMVEDPEISLADLDWRRPHQEWPMAVQMVRAVLAKRCCTGVKLCWHQTQGAGAAGAHSACPTPAASACEGMRAWTSSCATHISCHQQLGGEGFLVSGKHAAWQACAYLQGSMLCKGRQHAVQVCLIPRPFERRILSHPISCNLQVTSRQFSQGVAQGLKAILDTDSTRGADLMAAYNHMALTEGMHCLLGGSGLPAVCGLWI